MKNPRVKLRNSTLCIINNVLSSNMIISLNVLKNWIDQLCVLLSLVSLCTIILLQNILSEGTFFSMELVVCFCYVIAVFPSYFMASCGPQVVVNIHSQSWRFVHERPYQTKKRFVNLHNLKLICSVCSLFGWNIYCVRFEKYWYKEFKI